jgi:2-dehydropantoate 2-reductase
MRYAVLGPGGVGGLIGGALAHQGHPVALIVRPESVDHYPRQLAVRSSLVGDFEAPARPTAALTEPVDVVWIAVKSVDLEPALEQVPVDQLADGVVIPLLNGIDHVEVLRTRFGADHVIPAAVRVEAERESPGHIRHVSAFMAIELAPPPHLRERAEAIAEEVRATGIACEVLEDDASVMWRKLTMLAPNALTTAASGRSVQGVWGDPEWMARYEACVREACAVAAAEGVAVDPDALIANTQRLFARDHRTSMQKDVDAGRRPELEGIGGALVRRAERHGIDVPATRELIAMVEARVSGTPTGGAP